jgi:hypothetical protein
MLKSRTFLLLLANILLGLFIFLNVNKDETPGSEIISRMMEMTAVLDKIEILQPKSSQRIVFSKNTNEWKIEHPMSWSVEPISIANLISKLSHLNPSYICTIEDLEEKGEIAEDYGFDSNASSFILSSEVTAIQITLGDSTRDKNDRYLLITDSESESIWKGPKQIEQLISRPILEWAKLDFLDFPIYTIDELEVKTFRDGQVSSSTSLSKTQDQWSFKSPFQSLANENEVSSFLHKLVSTNLIGFAKKDEVQNFTTQYELNLRALGEWHQFEFLKNLKADQDFLLVQSSLHSASFYISIDFADNLSNLASKLREKRLFSLDLDDVRRIKIVESNQSITLRSTATKSWIGLENEGKEAFSFTADSELIRKLVHNLNTLEASSFVLFNPSPDDLREQGLDNPTYSLEVEMNDSTRKTLFASKLNSETSLWNTYVSEHAFVCLVENQWDQIISTQAIDYKDRRLLPIEYQTAQINIKSILDESISYSMTPEKGGEAYQRFVDFQADSFIDLSYNNEGIWHNGDWLPWKYSLQFIPSDSNDFKPIEFQLTDRIGGTKWFVGSEELGLVANLPITIIDELAKGTSGKDWDL